MRSLPAQVASGETIGELPIDSVSSQGYNLRKLDQLVIEDLKRSIRAVGLLQPIMVRPLEPDRFEVVFGNHRLEAARQLGFKSIPTFVRRLSQQEAFLLQVTENIQRNLKMNPIAEARGYKQLTCEGLSIHEIASHIGKSDSYVVDRLRLLDKLAPEIRQALEQRSNGPISVSHAEQLSLLGSKAKQLNLARLVAAQGLTVRDLERIMSRGPTAFCICSKCGRLHRPPRVKSRASRPTANGKDHTQNRTHQRMHS